MSLEDGEEEEQWEGVVEAPASFVHSQGNSNSLFVKVNMEGVPIGRKIDLNTHNDYTSLSSALENMFRGPPNCEYLCNLYIHVQLKLNHVMYNLQASFDPFGFKVILQFKKMDFSFSQKDHGLWRIVMIIC
jgi:hypothetical protein